jgi:hypothetical protein
MGVARGEEHCPFHRMKELQLQPGDIIVYLSGSGGCVDDEKPFVPRE